MYYHPIQYKISQYKYAVPDKFLLDHSQVHSALLMLPLDSSQGTGHCCEKKKCIQLFFHPYLLVH